MCIATALHLLILSQMACSSSWVEKALAAAGAAARRLAVVRRGVGDDRALQRAVENDVRSCLEGTDQLLVTDDLLEKITFILPFLSGHTITVKLSSSIKIYPFRAFAMGLSDETKLNLHLLRFTAIIPSARRHRNYLVGYFRGLRC